MSTAHEFNLVSIEDYLAGELVSHLDDPKVELPFDEIYRDVEFPE